jgi:carbonic anhydrase
MRPSRSFLGRILTTAALSFLVLAAGYADSPLDKADGPKCPGGDWGYAESDGPEKWVGLSPCNCQCGNGGEQSPIDIVRPQRAALPPIRPSYGVVQALPVENNGHDIEATIPSNEPADKVTLRIGNVAFRLGRFHFHTRSEHMVAGKDAPIEMHLVNATPGGRTAVIGVFIQPGPANPELTKIWNQLPERKGDEITVTDFNLAALLPKSRASYRYAGSLTTPACGQGLQWIVMVNPITMTSDQIGKLQKIFLGNEEFPKGNRRPVQPLNGRTVLTDVR